MKKRSTLFSKHVIAAIAMLMLSLCYSLNTKAQLAFSFADARYELGFNVGPSFFLGDLGGNVGSGKRFVKDLNFPSTRYMIGASLSVYPSEFLGFRGEFNVGKVAGDDALAKGTDKLSDARRRRNLDFKSGITEAYLAAEFYPTTLFTLPYDYVPRLRPYVVAGIGLFHFNPKGSYVANGVKSWVALRDLHLEGQGMSEYPDRPQYSLMAVNFPVGIGIKFDASEKVSLGLELNHRFTNTDYIDDVSTTYIDPALFDKYLSAAQAKVAKYMYAKPEYTPRDQLQRGNTNKDAYFTISFRLSIKLGDSDSWFGRASSQVRCPSRW